MNSPLPVIEQAHRYLGLSWRDIAQAIEADESSLDGWPDDVMPSPAILARLEAVGGLISEMQSTFADEQAARDWLHKPLPAIGHQPPLDLVIQGRAQVLTDMLCAMNSGMSS